MLYDSASCEHVGLVQRIHCFYSLHLGRPKPDAAKAHLSYRVGAWPLPSLFRTCPPRLLRLT